MSVHNYVCIHACMTVLIMTGCTKQASSHPRIWAVGRNKSRSGEGVGLVTVCAGANGSLTNKHSKATSSAKHIQESMCCIYNYTVGITDRYIHSWIDASLAPILWLFRTTKLNGSGLKLIRGSTPSRLFLWKWRTTIASEHKTRVTAHTAFVFHGLPWEWLQWGQHWQCKHGMNTLYPVRYQEM